MITKDDVIKTAEMSKLKFDDQQLEKVAKELNDILDVVDRLNEIDTEGVDPLFSPIDRNNIFRDDVAVDSQMQEDLVKSSELEEGGSIVLPKVVI